MGFDSMKIQVILKPSTTLKTITLDSDVSVELVLDKLQLKPDTTIVLRNKLPIPIDEVLKKDQKLEIISVASGG